MKEFALRMDALVTDVWSKKNVNLKLLDSFVYKSVDSVLQVSDVLLLFRNKGRRCKSFDDLVRAKNFDLHF